MKKRDDDIIEKLIGKPKKLKSSNRHRADLASTLHFVKDEAVRRCREDGHSRIVYLKNKKYGIRLSCDFEVGEAARICAVDHYGRIIDFKGELK